MVNANDWLSAPRVPLPGDWAARPTFRLTNHFGQTAIMTETYADKDERTLEGHKIADFVRIAQYLKVRGLCAPQIYHADPDQGILIVEDFGAESFHHLLPERKKDFYPNAITVLLKMRSLQPESVGLKSFKDGYIFKRTAWFWDGYLKDEDTSKRTEFLSIWDDLIDKCAGQSFVHGDFHPGNLMPLPNNQIGLLDFGAAMVGDSHYDLVNLLEDIRRDVPSDIKRSCQKQYDYDHDIYTIFHAQFLMRIIGQLPVRGREVPDILPQNLKALLETEKILEPLKALVSL